MCVKITFINNKAKKHWWKTSLNIFVLKMFHITYNQQFQTGRKSSKNRPFEKDVISTQLHFEVKCRNVKHIKRLLSGRKSFLNKTMFISIEQLIGRSFNPTPHYHSGQMFLLLSVCSLLLISLVKMQFVLVLNTPKSLSF